MISSGLKHTNTKVDTEAFQRGVSLIKAGTNFFLDNAQQLMGSTK